MCRKKAQTIIASLVIGFASDVAALMSSEGPAVIKEADTCQSHLSGLVSYLEETAQIEGMALSVEWNGDGEVLLNYDGYVQRMWCQQEELHVAYRMIGIASKKVMSQKIKCRWPVVRQPPQFEFRAHDYTGANCGRWISLESQSAITSRFITDKCCFSRVSCVSTFMFTRTG